MEATTGNSATEAKRPIGAKVEKVMTTRITIQMILFLGFGVLFILVGSIVGAFWPTIFNYIMKKEFTLSPTSSSYDLWKETPFPLYMRCYMFNWTNPREVLLHHAKPNFHQMGPYVFREHHSKKNVTWNDNSTVTFFNMRQWHFAPELSNGSLTDNVTNINVIAMTLGSLIEKFVPKKLLPFINRMITMEEPIYITKPVGQLLFDGYSDPFLSLAARLKKIIKEIDLPIDKFGWFYGRNMSVTYDGVFNMYTGKENFTNLGLLSSWNYSQHVKFYKGACGRVIGSTGELWPANIAKKNNAIIFANDLCSTLTLSRGPGYLAANNLHGIEFIGGADVFNNESCYCITKPCHPYGVREISTCWFSAPVFISFPHFYLADPIYRKSVSGLNPNSSLHQFKIAFDEETGIPLEVNARLQVNIFSQPIAMFNMLNMTLPRAMFPMLWFEQHAVVEGQVADKLILLDRLGSSGMPFFFCILAFGLILGLVGIYLSYAGGWRKHHEHTLLTEDSSQSSDVPSS